MFMGMAGVGLDGAMPESILRVQMGGLLGHSLA